LAPWPLRPRDVERLADVAYGEHGAANLLDVYRHRSRPSPAPTLVFFHGGGFRRGRKSRESRSLLFRLAGQGWTCISANYRLARTPAAGFPAHLVDAKRVVAWAREEGDRYGIDPDAIFLAGSSAGAHLTAMAAVTANTAEFQPGFEGADTSFAGGIGMGGYYGALSSDEHPASTPAAYSGVTAPPFLIVHGDLDTFTPIQGARTFADWLRESSTQPVAFVSLPGAQHSFDLFRNVQLEAAIDGIEAFTAWVRTIPRRT
jgi:acetyl esterase/lipase